MRLSRTKIAGLIISLIIFGLVLGACSGSPGSVPDVDEDYNTDEDYNFNIVEDEAEFAAALQDEYIEKIILAADIGDEDADFNIDRDIKIEGNNHSLSGELILGDGSSALKIEIEELELQGKLTVDVTAQGEVKIFESSLEEIAINSVGSESFYLTGSEADRVELTSGAENARFIMNDSRASSLYIEAPGTFIEIISQSSTLSSGQYSLDYLQTEESAVVVGETYIKEVSGIIEAPPIEQISFFDLAEGYNSINVPSLEQDEYIYTILFPQDDSGASHAAGSFLTAFSSDESQDSSFKDYLREQEQKTLQDHAEVTSSTRDRVTTLEAAPEYDIGDRTEFWVRSERDVDDYFVEQELELKRKSDNALIWVDDYSDISEDDIDYLLAQFDGYHGDLQDYFGGEPESSEFPILEAADSRINIVLASFEPGGYFNSADLYSSDRYRHSNEGKFIYADPGSSVNIELIAGIIAHEYQHLLYYNEKVLAGRSGFNLWINEGFSELAMDIAGFGYLQGTRTGAVYSFARRPEETSLVNWGSRLSDYGASYLFARYLYDRFGREIITEISRSPIGPKKAIADYTGREFNEIFQDWSVALLAGSNGIEIDSSYSFSDSIAIPEFEMEKIISGEQVDNQDLIGWGMKFTRIKAESAGDLLIEIDDLSQEGNFRKVVVREDR